MIRRFHSGIILGSLSFSLITTTVFAVEAVGDDSAKEQSQDKTSEDKTANSKSKDLLPSDLLQISSTDAFRKYGFLVDKSARNLVVCERKGETIEKILDVPSDIGKNSGNKSKRDDA